MENWKERLSNGGWVGFNDADMDDYNRAILECEAKVTRFNSEVLSTPDKQSLFEDIVGYKLQGRTTVKSPFRCDLGFNIKLGKDVLVNYNCTFLDTAEISVGDYTMIGPDCHIVTAIHPISGIDRRDWKVRGEPIHIGKDVWIGANVTILPGVDIGDDCVIGAGSVVTKDVPSGMTVVGNPARPIQRH